MLEALEKRTLELVIFDERFADIQQELNEPEPIVLDTIKNLLVKDMLCILEFNEEKRSWKVVKSCDWDHVDDFKFRATSKGLKAAGMI